MLLCRRDTGALTHPLVRNGARPRLVVHHEDQVVIVIAVYDFDIDAGIGHAAREGPELPRLRLSQAQRNDVTLLGNANARGSQRSGSIGAVVEKKMRDAASVNAKDTPTLDAHAGSPERVAHLGERARPVVEDDLQILHASVPSRNTITD